MANELDLEAIYKANWRYLWSCGRRLGVPEAQLEDIVHDVFIVASQRWQSFEGRAAVRTWLYGILFRLASDARRKEQRRAGNPKALVSRIITRGALDEKVAAQEAAQLLADLLDELDEGQRMVYVLYELEELDGNEIAQMLGVSRNTVYSRLRLARKRLAAQLRRRLEEEEAEGDAF